MTHPDIRAALGRERQNTLLAEAEAARTARQARLYRRQAATPARRGSPPQCRAGIGAEVVLRDGSAVRSEEHTSEFQSRPHLVCRLLLEKKKKKKNKIFSKKKKKKNKKNKKK